MFTLKDIEMLQVPENTKMIVIREHKETELDNEMKTMITKQFKKALKLPVIFLPDNVDIQVCDKNNG